MQGKILEYLKYRIHRVSDNLDYDELPLNAIYFSGGHFMTIVSIEEGKHITTVMFKAFIDGVETPVLKIFWNNPYAYRSLKIDKEENAVYQIAPYAFKNSIPFLETIGVNIEKITLAERFHFYKASKAGVGEFLLWENSDAVGKLLNELFDGNVDVDKLINIPEVWVRSILPLIL